MSPPQMTRIFVFKSLIFLASIQFTGWARASEELRRMWNQIHNLSLPYEVLGIPSYSSLADYQAAFQMRISFATSVRSTESSKDLADKIARKLTYALSQVIEDSSLIVGFQKKSAEFKLQVSEIYWKRYHREFWNRTRKEASEKAYHQRAMGLASLDVFHTINELKRTQNLNPSKDLKSRIDLMSESWEHLQPVLSGDFPFESYRTGLENKFGERGILRGYRIKEGEGIEALANNISDFDVEVDRATREVLETIEELRSAELTGMDYRSAFFLVDSAYAEDTFHVQYLQAARNEAIANFVSLRTDTLKAHALSQGLRRNLALILTHEAIPTPILKSLILGIEPHLHQTADLYELFEVAILLSQRRQLSEDYAGNLSFAAELIKRTARRFDPVNPRAYYMSALKHFTLGSKMHFMYGSFQSQFLVLLSFLDQDLDPEENYRILKFLRSEIRSINPQAETSLLDDEILQAKEEVLAMSEKPRSLSLRAQKCLKTARAFFRALGTHHRL